VLLDPRPSSIADGNVSLNNRNVNAHNRFLRTSFEYSEKSNIISTGKLKKTASCGSVQSM